MDLNKSKYGYSGAGISVFVLQNYSAYYIIIQKNTEI